MNIFRFITILFVTITLSALLTHLLELPGKIHLTKQDYQTVQQIYRGWSWLGIFEIGGLLLTLIWTIIERKRRPVFPFLLVALLLFSISLAIFFFYTFPANTSTSNWTQLPGEWEKLRSQWEYSHAVRALLNLAGFCLLVTGLLRNKN